MLSRMDLELATRRRRYDRAATTVPLQRHSYRHNTTPPPLTRAAHLDTTTATDATATATATAAAITADVYFRDQPASGHKRIAWRSWRIRSNR